MSKLETVLESIILLLYSGEADGQITNWTLLDNFDKFDHTVVEIIF